MSAAAPPAPLLAVSGLAAGYGASQVLFDVSFDVYPGEVVTLLGRNGMGKSTTIKCVTGQLAPRAGEIRIDGRSFAGATNAAGEIGHTIYVPGGRRCPCGPGGGWPGWPASWASWPWPCWWS